MSKSTSFVKHILSTQPGANALTPPSAIISDGTPLLTIPLYAVSTISLSQSYHLPPIGTTGSRAVVATHDDTLSLSGLLVGPERFAWKVQLETAAEAGRRGSFIQSMSGGRISGLILITSMTIRTDMHVQSLTFSASSGRRDVLDVSISLVHLPLPSALSKLLDVANLGVAALTDWGG